MPAKDLPGFYFDPEKNRYFPLKGPVPGRAPKRPAPPEQGCTPCETQRMKITKAAELLSIRELHGNVFNLKNQKHSFEQMCRDGQTSNPSVWKYESTDGLADSALGHFYAMVQTPKGQKKMSFLSSGSMSGCISLRGVGKVGQSLVDGFSNVPVSILVNTCEEPNALPLSYWGSAEVSVILPCSVSSIHKIGGLSHSPIDDQLLLQKGLISTLGCGGYGGSVYILNLTEPLELSSGTFILNRRIHRVASLDYTLWTAICNPDGERAAIGTNGGAALINLESGKISWIYQNKSDIFSEQFDNKGNILLCGHRNGSIMSIDIRQKQGGLLEHSRRPQRDAIHRRTKKVVTKKL